MKVSDLLSEANENSGVKFIGLERKNAKIKNGVGQDYSDILGWDVIAKGPDGDCYGYYAAQPPLIGLTQPQPVSCPLGIVAFDEYKIDIKGAIDIFKTQNGGDKFTEVTLCWPLVHPAAPEPYWYFRTNLGNTVIIGANSGQIKGHSPIIVLYGARPE